MEGKPASPIRTAAKIPRWRVVFIEWPLRYKYMLPVAVWRAVSTYEVSNHHGGDAFDTSEGFFIKK